MDFNVEARKLQLENLEQFISSSKNKIQNVLNSIGWNAQNVIQDNHFITCSLDPSHKVPQKSIERHISKCGLRKEGYDVNEKFLSEPQSGISSIHIDDHKKIEILSAAHKSIEYFKSDNEIDKVVLMPQYKSNLFESWNGQDPDPKTADRLISTFSTDERLALYDHAVAGTTGPAVLPEFDIFSTNVKLESNKPLGLEEKLALERDLKRRKIKYKSVHTSHKNHVEVMREVIDGQMELYKDWLSASVKIDSLDKDTEINLECERIRSTAVSRNSNNSSSSKNTSKKRDDRFNEEINDSKSTSRRTSIDRISDRSYNESNNRSRFSRSISREHRQNPKENHDRKDGERYNHQYRKERSPHDRRRRDRRDSRDRRRSTSRERRHNGYRNHRNRY